MLRVLETALYADDLDAAAAFYEEVLGLERFAEAPGRHVFFRVAGATLLLFRPEATRVPPPEGALPIPPHGAEGPGHACFAASAGELVAWERRLAERGVAIEAVVEWPQGGRSIYFRDPAGNSLEFAEPRIWGLD
jgi:catechol 2,3-dioxygenase-like lactoylglutathione lyase family enzyme